MTTPETKLMSLIFAKDTNEAVALIESGLCDFNDKLYIRALYWTVDRDDIIFNTIIAHNLNLYDVFNKTTQWKHILIKSLCCGSYKKPYVLLTNDLENCDKILEEKPKFCQYIDYALKTFDIRYRIEIIIGRLLEILAE